MTITLPLLCFNDVYRVNQRFVPQPGSPEDPKASSSGSSSSAPQISVSQFAQLVYNEREQWADREEKGEDGEVEKEGLVVFAGDLFNPSVESSVTRGSHMVSLAVQMVPS
jgi:5'-nucleotidase